MFNKKSLNKKPHILDQIKDLDEQIESSLHDAFRIEPEEENDEPAFPYERPTSAPSFLEQQKDTNTRIMNEANEIIDKTKEMLRSFEIRAAEYTAILKKRIADAQVVLDGHKALNSHITDYELTPKKQKGKSNATVIE